MASIRRTLSPAPAHGRSFPFHTHFSPPPRAPPLPLLRRLLIGFSLQKPYHRKPPSPPPPPLPLSAPSKKSLLRFLLCFLLGLFLGLFPFADLDDSALRPHHFSFASLPPPSSLLLRSGGREIDIVLSEEGFAAVELEEARKVAGGAFEVDLSAAPPNNNKLLIVVTPTYNRALQAYFLNRLGQTLRLVPPPLLWIVVEMGSLSSETAEILRGTGVMYRHLVCRRNSSDVKDRGVHQRNTALEHIERHRLDGIVYFADDDNIYALELFDRIREIRRFGTWPVAMLAQSKNKAILEGPVCNGSQVIGWHTNEKSKRLRRFHVDMSGFAFNSTILWDPRQWQRPTSNPIRQLDTVKEGFQETSFMEQLVEDESQMEGIPDGCSRIMNWHLHLEARHLVYPRGWQVTRNLDVVIPLK